VSIPARVGGKRTPHKNQRISKGLLSTDENKTVPRENQETFHSENMSRYRRVRIRTATSEVLSLRHQPDKLEDAFCALCGANVGWLGLTDAAAVRQVTAKELIREVEDGQLHARETAGGRLRICRVSLLRD
jgi:hypothetical protein